MINYYKSLNENAIINGVEKVNNAVKETFGPMGKCVAIKTNFGLPDITRDGATVAKAITLKDEIENLGAEIVKSAASSTEDQAGDGTTTTTILLSEMLRQAKNKIRDGHNLNEVKDGMYFALKEVTEYIKSHSTPVDGDLDKIHRVATISANNNSHVGDLIVDCMKKVGVDGVITSDVGNSIEDQIEIASGFKVDRGWSSPNFITEAKEGECVLDAPAILVVAEKLSSIPQIQPILSSFFQNCQGRSIMIFCDDIDDVVLTTLLINHLQGRLKCCVVKGIDFGDNRKNIMEDIATYTGATFVCSDFNLELSKVGIEVLGEAKKVVVSKDSTIIFEGEGDPDTIKARLEILKSRLEDPKISKFEKDKFERRVASLGGGVGIIKAGGVSKTEQENKKATIDDAILASKSALSEGVVTGGGLVFLRAYFDLTLPKNITDSNMVGWEIVMDSLPIIIKTISENSGKNGEVVINNIKAKKSKENFGYNAKVGTYGDLFDMGVLDSAKVLRVSLENAISNASMIILTSCVVYEEKKKDDETL